MSAGLDLGAFDGQRIWIVGASSGIGLALARHLDGLGARLVLSARRADLLEALAKDFRTPPPLCLPLDVSEPETLRQAVVDIEQAMGGLDRALNLASIYEPGSLQDLTALDCKAMVDVNLLGAFHFVMALLPLFERQAFGQLAVTASVAGYFGLTKSQPYAATKAAALSLMQTLHAEAPDGLDVKIINPGFVQTPMTAKNDFPMPMAMSVEEAACALVKGLSRRGFEVHFPKKFIYLMKFFAVLPYWASLPLNKRLVGPSNAS